ncbi:hypothetical protein RchiOBHm_Chr6g0273291 [Rosa chinensis]|uniref:Uncharacterized protein n=1 Tax=Rosa chinensis TaxID=74649 RepID=A0A2P6PRG0_ROSCH|nr:hypothetical protein RchiOBHm_Chr6g0273291 [Rosa chinensis]
MPTTGLSFLFLFFSSLSLSLSLSLIPSAQSTLSLLFIFFHPLRLQRFQNPSLCHPLHPQVSPHRWLSNWSRRSTVVETLSVANRFDASVFTPVISVPTQQASILLALFASGDGYRVEENDRCLMVYNIAYQSL